MTQLHSPTLGLYIHWPFCLSKCPYCDFNSHVRASIDDAAWKIALVREMEHIASLTPGHTLSSIFFGGGTPSLMNPGTVAALIQQAQALWPAQDNLEITLEANPTSVEAQKFDALSQAGVNRVSLGVQSLRPEALKTLGRQHSVDQARKAVALARDLFPRFSFDLIYGRPQQMVIAWKDELTEALTWGASHMSLYQLTYEPGTPFYTQFQRGDLAYPLEDDAVAFDEATQELMNAQGFERYEISNYARPDQECRHNLIYWQSQSYAGIGPGAHGRIKNPTGQTIAMRTHRAPEVWLERVQNTGHGIVSCDPLTPQQRFEEVLMMGLRLAAGVPLARIQEETGQPLEAWVPQHKLEALANEGLVQHPIDAVLALTKKGQLRLNSVLAYLVSKA